MELGDVAPPSRRRTTRATSALVRASEGKKSRASVTLDYIYFLLLRFGVFCVGPSPVRVRRSGLRISPSPEEICERPAPPPCLVLLLNLRRLPCAHTRCAVSLLRVHSFPARPPRRTPSRRAPRLPSPPPQSTGMGGSGHAASSSASLFPSALALPVSKGLDRWSLGRPRRAFCRLCAGT